MKITGIKTVGAFGGRQTWSFVLVETDAGITGVGESSVEGKEKAVEEAVQDLARLVIGRDPMRKLGPGERLVGAMELVEAYDKPSGPLACGVAAGFLFRDESDPSSLEIRRIVEEEGIQKALTQICGLPDDSPWREEVEKKVNELKDWGWIE